MQNMQICKICKYAKYAVLTAIAKLSLIKTLKHTVKFDRVAVSFFPFEEKREKNDRMKRMASDVI
jgi:hypothetical protein